MTTSESLNGHPAQEEGDFVVTATKKAEIRFNPDRREVRIRGHDDGGLNVPVPHTE